MEQESTSISQLVKSIADIDSKLSNAQKIDCCCFVLGLTGSGKSTFISCYCGANLTFIKKNGKYRIQNNDESKFPKIGNTNFSCTTIPSLYTSPEGTVFYDPPGFLDTRGITQEIINAYCNAKMFRLGSKAKIIIVVEVSSLLSARGGAFVDVALRLRQLFANDFFQVVNSCFLLVSKVNQIVMTQEEVIGNVQEIINENKLLGQGAMLLKTLLFQKRIACFPIPEKIDRKILENLTRQISRLPQFSIVENAKVSLSSQAKRFTEQLMKHLENDKSALMQIIGQELKVSFLIKLEDKKHLENALMNLKSAKQMIQNKELESGIGSKLDELQKKLLIKQAHIEKLKEWKKQLIFCLTIHPTLNIPTKVTDILLKHISIVQKELELGLNKIATKQQRDQMDKKHSEALKNQENKYKDQFSLYKKEVQKNEKYLKQQADNNYQNFAETMKQMSQSHRKEIRDLKQQMRRNNQSRSSGSQWCEIY